MSASFGPEYAAAYDALYADKDYDAECDTLEGIFGRSGRTVRTVLDLGCGTGAHAVRLAQRGFDVVGVDLSEGMLEVARRRAEQEGATNATFVSGDIRSVRLDRRFDAVICMFAVLGYQTAEEDVSKAVETVRRHLVPGGLFVFDVWYGPAVEATGPSARVKVVETTEGQIERHASARLQAGSRLCAVSYRLIHRRPGAPDVVTEEVHQMRYFFEDDLERFLAAGGLSLDSLKPFPDTTGTPSTETWNVLATARG